MEFSAFLSHFDVNGNLIGTQSYKANGQRIPLKLVPDTFKHLPIPPEPQRQGLTRRATFWGSTLIAAASGMVIC